MCVLFVGSHGLPEINHNDDYEWYYGSLCVLDGGQPPAHLYRGGGGGVGGGQLTAGDAVDVKAARCCGRRPDDALCATSSVMTNFTQPCQSLCCSFSRTAYLIYFVIARPPRRSCI